MTSDEDLNRRIAEAEAWLDALDPSRTPLEDIRDLRAIAEAVDEVARAERRVRDAVEKARANGRSWGRISIALGVSRQSAHERFGGRDDPPGPRTPRNGGAAGN